jgi:hypothetical protein
VIVRRPPARHLLLGAILLVLMGALPNAMPASASLENPLAFVNYAVPSALDGATGEPSIGVNWNTGNVMFESGLKTLRVTFNEAVTPATATWTDVSAPTSKESMDPILFTDPVTGRTVVSHLISSLVVPGGGCSLSSTTDDDGATWIPSTGCGIPGAFDHQSVGGGPFADPSKGVVYPHSMYYCGQNGQFANCALSLDGGMTYGPSMVMYTDPGTPLTGRCQGLHGHVKVGPDGTAYVPDFDCGTLSKQGLVVTRDDGLHWTVNEIPDSAYNNFRSDPSVGIASDNTVYYAYEAPEGPIKLAVSQDHGTTWTPSTDLTTPIGVQNAVFPAVIAGDGPRAAVAFLGSKVPGNYEDASYAGVWHLYIAFTYDRGATWEVVDATPTDPVQRGCIWWGNGSCPSAQRNLLDFFDEQIDSHGRVLVGYADGCINACVSGGANTRSKLATIARQSAGKPLFAKDDPPPPTG